MNGNIIENEPEYMFLIDIVLYIIYKYVHIIILDMTDISKIHSEVDADSVI